MMSPARPAPDGWGSWTRSPVRVSITTQCGNGPRGLGPGGDRKPLQAARVLDEGPRADEVRHLVACQADDDGEGGAVAVAGGAVEGVAVGSAGEVGLVLVRHDRRPLGYHCSQITCTSAGGSACFGSRRHRIW